MSQNHSGHHGSGQSQGQRGHGAGGGGSYRGGHSRGGQGGGGGGFRGGRGGQSGLGQGTSVANPGPLVPVKREEVDMNFLEQLEQLRLNGQLDYAEKMDAGDKGQECDLISNLVPFKLVEDLTVYHYDVQITRTFPGKQPRPLKEGETPTVLPKAVNFKVMSHFIHNNSGRGGLFTGLRPVFDGGKNLYTKRQLTLNGPKFVTQWELKEDQRDKDTKYFIITIQPADPFEIQISADDNELPQEHIQILDIIARYGPTLSKITIGQKIFHPISSKNHERRSLGRNMECAFGFYQSVRATESGLALNVDQVAGAFYTKGPMLHVIAKMLGRSEPFQTNDAVPDERIRSLGKELKGLRFRALHLQKTQTMSGLSRLPMREITFQKDGQNVSIIDYYFDTYKIKLQYRNMVCLTARIMNKDAYYPLELCELVEDQFVKKKLPTAVSSEFTKVSVQKPHKRFQEIQRAVETIMKEGQAYLGEFGLQIEPAFIPVKGRIIEPPKLRYKEESFQPPQDSTWNLRGKRLYETVPLTKWMVFQFCPPSEYENVKSFLSEWTRELGQTAKMSGFSINPPLHSGPFNFENEKQLKALVFERINNTPNFKGLQLLIFLGPSPPEYYDAVKQLGDVDHGIPTQYVNTDKHDRKTLLSKAYLANLLLGINSKIGGKNAVAEGLPEKTMVIGLDVTHPSPQSGLKQSIAACVATFDSTMSLWDAVIAVQNSATPIGPNGKMKRVYEMVELEPVVKELLEKYKGHNKGELPKRILVYRDGVSEGQFREVMDKELEALLGLFDDMDLASRPHVTYIVVQKRHNVRLATADNRDNPTPGTVVDTGITDPAIFDFFLGSHKALQGTSRPTRYRVLYDENGFTSDEIQQLTNTMCYTYSGCTKAISIPTPVKLADLAAYRARIHIGDQDDTSTIASGSGGEQELDDEMLEQLNELVKVNTRIRGTQYMT